MPVDVHRFPALGDRVSSDFSKAGKESTVFKPMFSAGSSAFAVKAMGHSRVSDNDALTTQVNAQASQKRLQEGIAAGRLEGEQLAREELAPDVANFLEARIQLSNQIGQLAAETSTQAVKLSLAITQAILGPDIVVTENGLAPLLSNLRRALGAGYHATLPLPPADMTVLNEIVQADGAQGLDALPGVTITADSRLAGGCLQIPPTGLDAQALIEKTRADLMALLENLSLADQ